MGASAGSHGREAARLLAQWVSRCDLLQMESADAGANELAACIARMGRLAMEAARQAGADGAFPNGKEQFANTTAVLLQLLEQAQQLAAEAPGAVRGEDLLSLQVAALELKSLADPKPRTSVAVAAGAPAGAGAHLLLVDDDEGNREILARMLRGEPWQLQLAASGLEALQAVVTKDFDLVMLDVLMPGMDGLTVLRRLRLDPRLRDVPVIMLSGVDQTANVLACLEAGAADYVAKPFNPVLLRARIRNALEHRRTVQSERAQTVRLEQAIAELERSRTRQEELIAAMLPSWAVRELRENGAVAPRYSQDVTVVFTDFAGFTSSCAGVTAYELVDALNRYFSAFDDIVGRYGLERLKTVGDAYMCAAGLHDSRPSHPIDAVLAGMEMLEVVARLAASRPSWQMRVGLNTGPVVSGIVGNQRLAFDIWGDTVNLAARMVSAGMPGRINLSEKTFQRVKELFHCEARGPLPVKGSLVLEMFFVQAPAVGGGLANAADARLRFAQRYRNYFGYELASLPPGLFRSQEATGLNHVSEAAVMRGLP